MSQITESQKAGIRESVLNAVNNARITDIHTHLYSQHFGPLLLWGIDDLLTYHYLIAETIRWGVISADDFWKLSKQEQANLIWKTLFIDHSPCSESCRGVLTVLDRLGLDTSSRDLAAYRKYFESQRPEDYINRVFEVAGVDSVIMTNDPFDKSEHPVWLEGKERDPRFHAALRIDPLLSSWATAWPVLAKWGYDVEEDLAPKTLSEVRRFLEDWIDRIGALYMAVSLPPDFAFPEDSIRGKLITECVLPVAREKGIPFAMMIGVRRSVNPRLRSAGDSVGKAHAGAIEYMCADYPDNKFMITMLSRENQHELCVAARKFPNLMLFGCWWFLNNPSLIDEITRMRLDLLGLGFIPQHSDARVLDQLIYKWAHSRKIIGEDLAQRYVDLAETGWKATDEEISRDVAGLFGGNFWLFLKR